MPPIAEIGTEVKVTPGEVIQIVLGTGKHEVVEDRSPFSVYITGIIEESGEIIGVYGEVVSGHQRYRNQTATLPNAIG